MTEYHLEHGITESVEELKKAIGKKLIAVNPINYGCPVFGFELLFDDGSRVEVCGEHDEGVIAEFQQGS